MPTRRSLLLTLLLLPGATFALSSDDAAARRRADLFRRLRNAMTEPEGRLAEGAVWHMWMGMAPSIDIARAIADAMDARESYDFDKALVILDRVVMQAPGYSEGWNQRAFIRFLKADLDGALNDIERALELEPKHFAALAGKAMILMQQGRMELGQDALRHAVEIHPWLRERSMLLPVPSEATPGPGRDI